ncbi:MAG: hypothetical protein SH868_12610 [Bythopirellula sp.]|nr:hypothetical protein [Bythopirellula sp.]
MQISIPDNVNLPDQAVAAGFANVEAYVFHLIERDTERMAIQEGLDAVRQGRTRPFAEFDAEFRKKYGIASQ